MLEQVEQNAPFTEEQNAELDALVERYPEVKAKHDAIAKKVQGSNEVQNENEPVEELGQDDDEVKAPVDPVIAATLKKGRETGGISPESKDEARKAIHHNFKPTKKGSAAIDQVLDTLERVVGQDAFKKVKIVFADKNALAVAGIKNRAGGWASKGEGGVLMLNKDAPENKGDGIVETLFHEVGHGIAEGIDDFISKEFNSLTPEQRKAAALEYDKKDTRSDAELMADKNTRQEWFNFQLFRVAKAGPEAYMKDHGISDKFAEKVVSVWNELREMVTQWIGDSSLSTEALDAKIEDLLFSGNFDQAATAEAAAGQKELDAKAKDDPYADFSGDLKMEPNDETLLPMARSTNQSVRQAVAEYEGATENALLALVEDGLYPMDAKRALSNPNATQKVLEAGIDHADPEVHAQAQDIIIENGKAEQARFAEEDANRKRGDKRRPKKGPTFLSEEGFRKFHEWEFYTERVADPLDPKEVASIRKKHGDSYAEAFIQGFKDGKIRAGNTEDEQASSERVVLDRYEVNEHGVVLNPESVELLSSKKDKVSLIVEYAETKDGRVAAAFGLQKEYGNSHGVSSGVSDKSGAVVADVNAAKVNAIEYALRILKGDDTISPGAHKKHAPKAIAKLEAMLADLPTPPTPPKKKAKAPAKPKKGEMAFTEAPSDMPAVMTMKESDRYIWQHVNEEADLMRAWEAGAALYEVRGNDTEFPRVTDVSQLKPGGSIMVAKDRDGPQT